MPAHFQQPPSLETDLKAAIRPILDHLPRVEEELAGIPDRSAGESSDPLARRFLEYPESPLGEILQRHCRIT